MRATAQPVDPDSGWAELMFGAGLDVRVGLRTGPDMLETACG